MRNLLLILGAAGVALATDCWKDAYGRGVGTVITTCPETEQKDGALCYPFCKDDFYGVGPVCWQYCPAGFKDTGVDCLKPSAYGRGAGYPLWEEDKCNAQNPQGCEKNGAIWYPKCKEGFHNFGCCICSPDCQDGQIDIGVSCQKKSYGRGAGKPLGCPSNKEEQASLCYFPCKTSYDGNGPVCWAECPAGSFDCGALCVDSSDACTDQVKNITTSVVYMALEIAAAATGDIDIMALIKSIGGVAIDLAKGLCEVPSAAEFLSSRRY